MIRRFLTVILAMLLLSRSPPGHVVNSPTTPAPVTPAIQTPGGITLRPLASPDLTPATQPGLYTSDPILTEANPAGPFAAGAAWTLAVVGVLPDPAGQSVLVALRNLTANGITAATVTVIAATATGPVGSATNVLTPAWIGPGGLAFAHVALDVAPGTITAQALPTVTALGIVPGPANQVPVHHHRLPRARPRPGHDHDRQRRSPAGLRSRRHSLFQPG